MTALLLIAHGSRRPEANADLVHIAAALAGRYPIIEVSYLELAEPTIPDAGRSCVRRGATAVVMMPYFLSAGVHVRTDLDAIRQELGAEFPQVEFVLAEPLGRHPLLLDIVAERAASAEAQFKSRSNVSAGL